MENMCGNNDMQQFCRWKRVSTLQQQRWPRLRNPSHWHSFQLSIKGHSNWQFYCILPERIHNTHNLFVDSLFSLHFVFVCCTATTTMFLVSFMFVRARAFFKAWNPFAPFKRKFYIQSMPSSCWTCFSLNFQIDTQLNRKVWERKNEREREREFFHHITKIRNFKCIV